MKWIVLAFLAGIGLEMATRNRQETATHSPNVHTPLVEPPHQRQPMPTLPSAEAMIEASPLGEQAQLLLTLLSRAPLDDIPNILNTVSEQVHGLNRNLLRRLVVTVWLERDAKHLLEYLDTMGLERVTSELDDLVFRTWAVIDPERAFEVARSLEPVRGLQAQVRVLREMAQISPRRALELILQNPKLGETSNWRRYPRVGTSGSFSNPYYWAISALAKQSPDDAVKQLPRLPQSQRESAMSTIASRYGRVDPEAGLRWIDSLPQTDLRSKLERGLYYGWFVKEQGPVIDVLTELEPGEDRDAMVGWILGEAYHCSDAERQRLLGLLSETGREEHALKIAKLLQGREAADLAMLGTEDRWKQQTFVSMWAAQEPEVAWDWAVNTDEAYRERAVTLVNYELLDRDTVSVAQLIAKTDDIELEFLTDAVIDVARAYATEDLSAAYDWAHALPPKLNDEALRRVALEWWHQDSIGLREEIARQAPSEQRDSMLYATFRRWLDQPESIPEAVDWIRNLEEAPSFFVSRAYRAWVKHDVTAASGAIRELPRNAIYDTAVGQLVSEIHKEDKALARQWAETIGDESKRANALNQIDPPPPSKGIGKFYFY